MRKYMTIKLQDGSVWGVPLEMIARDRRETLEREYLQDLTDDLCGPSDLFIEHSLASWALHQMSWGNFHGHQVKIADARPPDFYAAWARGEYGFSDGVES